MHTEFTSLERSPSWVPPTGTADKYLLPDESGNLTVRAAADSVHHWAAGPAETIGVRRAIGALDAARSGTPALLSLKSAFSLFPSLDKSTKACSAFSASFDFTAQLTVDAGLGTHNFSKQLYNSDFTGLDESPGEFQLQSAQYPRNLTLNVSISSFPGKSCIGNNTNGAVQLDEADSAPNSNSPGISSSSSGNVYHTHANSHVGGPQPPQSSAGLDSGDQSDLAVREVSGPIMSDYLKDQELSCQNEPIYGDEDYSYDQGRNREQLDAMKSIAMRNRRSSSRLSWNRPPSLYSGISSPSQHSSRSKHSQAQDAEQAIYDEPSMPVGALGEDFPFISNPRAGPGTPPLLAHLGAAHSLPNLPRDDRHGSTGSIGYGTHLVGAANGSNLSIGNYSGNFSGGGGFGLTFSYKQNGNVPADVASVYGSDVASSLGSEASSNRATYKDATMGIFAPGISSKSPTLQASQPLQIPSVSDAYNYGYQGSNSGHPGSRSFGRIESMNGIRRDGESHGNQLDRSEYQSPAFGTGAVSEDLIPDGLTGALNQALGGGLATEGPNSMSLSAMSKNYLDQLPVAGGIPRDRPMSKYAPLWEGSLDTLHVPDTDLTQPGSPFVHLLPAADYLNAPNGRVSRSLPKYPGFSNAKAAEQQLSDTGRTSGNANGSPMAHKTYKPNGYVATFDRHMPYSALPIAYSFGGTPQEPHQIDSAIPGIFSPKGETLDNIVVKKDGIEGYEDDPDDDSGSTPGGRAPKRDRTLKRCPICNRKLRRDLTRHMRTHEPVAFFACPFPRSVCSHKRGQFNRPYEYKKHLINAHFTFHDAEGFKRAQNLVDRLKYSGRCKCGVPIPSAAEWIQKHVEKRECILLKDVPEGPQNTAAATAATESATSNSGGSSSVERSTRVTK